MDNKPLVDMTPEGVQERKKQRTKDRELAERVWDTMCNEGDNTDKEYWIKGFVIGLNFDKE